MKTATNYPEVRPTRDVLRGKQSLESQPVFDDQPTGPWWSDDNDDNDTHDKNDSNQQQQAQLPQNISTPRQRQQRILPKRGYVLTKNHCGPPCIWCTPNKYIQMYHHFRQRCFRADKMTIHNGTKTITKDYYLPTKVKKLVHLIRDPLDNIVSRFRYERMQGKSALHYNSTRTDFRAYCHTMHHEFVQSIKQGRYVDPTVRRVLESVPCWPELLKWTEWHNYAFVLAADLQLPTLVLHYEDYNTQLEKVTSQLLSFLELVPPQYNPPYFEPLKHYRDYFENEEIEAAEEAIRRMSLRETWVHIARYFL
jgi:hypothetical protein